MTVGPQVLLAELDDLRATSSRAVLVEVHCAESRREALVSRLRAHLGPDAVVLAADGSAGARAQLVTLNASRDLALRSVPAIVLVVTSGDETRWARSVAPDLTAALDYVAEVEAPAPGGWTEVVEAARSALAARHRSIDLTGLVPATGDGVELSLDETYLQAAGIDTERLPEGRPTLVYGPPGAGKTTSLRWLCRRHAVGAPPALLPTRDLVLLVPLSAWWARLRDASVDLRTFVEREVGALSGAERVDLSAHLGDVVLLFDGLDEVPRQEVRKAVIEQAAALQRAGAVVVVTGRDHVAGEVGDDWSLVKMRVPGESEAIGLIRAVLAARGRRVEVARTAETVGNWLRRRGEMASFARSPLILVFVAILADLDGALPSVRIELYRDLVEMLVTSWRRVRSGVGAAAVRRADVFRVLAPLGREMVRRGVGGLTESELVEILVPLERRWVPTDEAAREAARARVAQLRDDTALLRTGETWSFVHPTFAEYFAALAALQDETFLAELASDPYAAQWSVVVPFTIALATAIEARDDVARRLVDALWAGVRDEGHLEEKALLLVTVYEETPSLPVEVRRRLVDEVLQIGLTRRLAPVALFRLAVRGLTDSSLLEVLSSWLCPPRRSVRLEALADSGVWRVLLIALGLAPAALRHVLWVSLLRHADPHVRRSAWSERDHKALVALDPEAAALSSLDVREPLPGFYTAAVEVYGEEAVRAAGLTPDPAA